MRRTVYTEVVVDMEDFDTDDLIEELESRGHGTEAPGDCRVMLKQIWQLRRQGQPYDHLMDAYLYAALGQVI